MAWGEFQLGEAVHDLTHLDPFTIKVTPKTEGAPTFKVLVSFSHHTFTRDLVDGDPDAQRFGPANDVRCFCQNRFALSRQLPALIAASVNGKAYFPGRHHKNQRSFLLVEIDPGQPPYVVVFNLERARNVDADVAMFVVSAHPRDNFPAKRSLDSIGFATLVSKVARGERIARPPLKK